MGRKHKYIYATSSSSEDSDSESSSSAPPPRHYRRRHHRSHKRSPSPPAPEPAAPAPHLLSASGTKDDSSSDKKKKKQKKPPQDSIDQIWDKFSQKKFSKALSVLPFAPVPASTSGDRGNELLAAGFERAAEECRRKVKKIISECKRVNTRYRDPGWDLDWDFKWEKGHCLNSLDKVKFEICHSNLINPASSIPKAVKRVHEIFEKPTFMENVLPGDIKQGSLGNCWFVASLTGLANVSNGIKRVCVEYDTKIGIYGFVFYRDGEWIYSIIDDKLYLRSPCWDSQSMQRELLQQIDREDVERVYRQTYQTGSKALFFAQNKDQNETWVPLIEKAYAKAHGDFACLAGGWIGEALEDLSGGVTTELLASDIFDTDAFWENELSKVNQEFLFGCSTGLLDAGYGNRNGISEGHAYVLMEARTLKNGTRLCKLRNPWGKIKKGNWEGAWSDGSKEWTTEVQEELNHTFGSDSTFWISYEDLLRKYQHFDRTRLFRDPDWRSCQRWIGVEVPWKPQYNEKFHIKLTRESPLVLVLSQLDTRYFRGLQGQYNFRLQFRLHEEGKPGAEEYVVRSHGNYLMDRSVSVEVPSLDPGSYVVYISVLGERNTRLLSTEDVIRRECRSREENEKLAQVGQAYDLAHAKAAGHLQRLAKVRRQAESKKASESRRKERKKNWEKRQIGREIARKQKDKDDAKKAALKAAKKAKAKAETETEAKEKAAKKEAAEKHAAEKHCPHKKSDGDEPKDKAVQTDARKSKEGASQTEADGDNASTTSTSTWSTGTPQYTPQDSPKTERAEPVDGDKDKVDVPPAAAENASTSAVSGGPPPPPATASADQPAPPQEQKPMELKIHCCSCNSCKEPPKAEETDYSSDSPVEDYELLYDEDDVTPSLRLAGAAAPAAASTNDQDSDEEDAPDPWNAIAVIGFRVYSKDEDLELRVIMEGGELEQHGMGNLGEADLDNAVSNAAGQRETKPQEPKGGEEKREEEVGEDEEDEEKVGTADKAKADAEGTAQSAEIISPEVEEATTVPEADGDKAEAKAGGPEEMKTAPGDGKAAYRTIIERQTSEYDRVMGKTMTDHVGSEAAKEEDPPSAGKDPHQPPEEKPAAQDEAAPVPTPRGARAPEEQLQAKTKTILFLRHKLQRGMLDRTNPPREEDMALMSDYLTRLEDHDDLEVSVIRATKIHRVLAAILKLARVPRDQEFSFSSRAQVLLDDYELALVTADDADTMPM